MKKESNVMYILRLTVSLLLITGVVAAVLAGVNAITKPEIERMKAEKTQKAIETVLPGGYEVQLSDFADETGLVSKVYKGMNGYAFEVAPAGFDGAITMMVGVGHDGKVLGISIVSHTETAGLGAVAAAGTSAGETFRNQFSGLSGQVSVSKDGGTVEAITGATITSKAICEGVNAALACFANLG